MAVTRGGKTLSEVEGRALIQQSREDVQEFL
jgi:hypothetical protein